MRRGAFWLRWSWRDLRQRWLLVIAIALVIAIGTGLYSGLGSMETWRKQSNDASFAALRAHDLKISLTEGSFARRGTLAGAVGSVPSRDSIADVDERLVAPTQLAVERPGGDPLVATGQIVGLELAPGSPPIDGVAADGGRTLTPADRGRTVGMLEASFSRLHDLPSEGTLRVAGGRSLRWVGLGRSPEYFLVTRPGGGDFGGAEISFGVVFTSLATAQALTGRPGMVNDAVLKLRDGSDVSAVQAQLEAALRRRGIGADVTTLSDEPAHRILYRDAEGDQEIYNVFAFLILLGAAFAAFNLATRIVESQRREIGVGMALGVPPRELAIRPLLLGVEIAAAGTAFGLLLGLAAGELFRGALEDLPPLPEMRTPFEPQVFARGALFGLLLPIAATAIPVWRGIRVAPIEAIRVGFRSAGSSGLAAFGKRVHVPGSALVQMPVRNLLRAPRRTVTTVLALGAVVGVVIAFMGMIDSFLATVDRSDAVVSGRTPSRITVALDTFHGRESAVVREIERTPGVETAEPNLQVPGAVASDDADFELSIELLDPRSPIWAPRTTEGEPLRPGEDGLLLSEEAAHDLGVAPGDEVSLTYPRRLRGGGFTEETAPLNVVGLHGDPFRSFAYMDAGQAGRMGLAGAVNALDVVPAPGISDDDLKLALFRLPGVAGVERATASTDFVRERMNDFVGILRVTVLFALLLALLIAFNTTSISADERSRENATMEAYGVTVPRIVGMSVLEASIAGLLGTIAGIGIGIGILSWVLNSTLPKTLPELGVPISISPGTLLVAALVGVVGVAVAPLLTARRIRRMDIPDTLRVVE